MLIITQREMPEVIWKHLKLQLEKCFGPKLAFSEDLDSESDLHFEYNYRKNLILPGKFNILILHEPQAVDPGAYKKKALTKFDLVLPMSPWRARNLGYKEWILHPFSWEHDAYSYEKIENRQLKHLVMINALKFSANKNSLYGLRREISRQLFRMNIDYDLYGLNWKMSKTKALREILWSIRKELNAHQIPKLTEAFSQFFYNYPEYSGVVNAKLPILQEYKYSLIIENEADYVTEKVFDSIIARSVPYYIGPNLNVFPELEKCVIQLPPNTKKICQAIQNENSVIYDEKRANIEKFLESPNGIAKFSAVSISNTIATHLKKNLRF